MLQDDRTHRHNQRKRNYLLTSSHDRRLQAAFRGRLSHCMAGVQWLLALDLTFAHFICKLVLLG